MTNFKKKGKKDNLIGIKDNKCNLISVYYVI